MDNWYNKKSFNANELTLACDGAKDNWDLTESQLLKLQNIIDMAEDLCQPYFFIPSDYTSIWEWIELHITN